MRGKRISDDLAELIYKLHDEVNENNRHPSHSAIAERIKRSKSLVTNVLKRRIEDTTAQQKVKLGRKFKTTPRQDRQLMLTILRNRSLPANHHLRSSGVLLSRWTVMRRIRKFNLRCRVAVQNVLNNRQRLRRVEFARRNIQRNWNNIIFSDECVITLKKGKKVGQLHVYRRNGERLLLQTSIKIPEVRVQGSATIWGCFSSAGFGCMEGFEGTMNSNHYVMNTLPNYLIPSIHLLHPEGRYIFQQDNASPHTARITREWLQENNVEVLEWPPYSPDLNPMENVWGYMKKKLYHDMPTTPQGAIECMRRMWLQLTPMYAQRLINSLQSRCRLVVRNKGLRI